MKNILIITENIRSFGRGITRGISRYARLQGDWGLIVQPDALEECNRLEEFFDALLAAHRVDAVVTCDVFHPLVEKLTESGLPRIEILGRFPKGESPYTIRVDDVGIAKTAFDHFEERGYRNFAFCGLEKIYWSDERLRAFSELAMARTGSLPSTCTLHTIHFMGWSDDERRDFFQWLEALPRPVALLACNDDVARCVVDACRQIGIRIPEEIALLGVDNDEFICSLSPVPLSSIGLATERAGFEAARLIDQILSGEPPQSQTVLMRAANVVLRDSSDQLAIEDPQLVLALEFIRQHAPRATVRGEDVAKASHVTVRTLERKFKQQLGHTMQEEIRRHKINLIRDLLGNTNLSIKEIAYACGFESPKHISRYFSRETGQAPLAYRTDIQAGIVASNA